VGSFNGRLRDECLKWLIAVVQLLHARRMRPRSDTNQGVPQMIAPRLATKIVAAHSATYWSKPWVFTAAKGTMHDHRRQHRNDGEDQDPR
jgi:hypothetical protein